MDYVTFVIQSLLAVYRPECRECRAPIFWTGIKLQRVKTLCLCRFVFATVCVFCARKGEILWDLRMKEQPQMLGMITINRSYLVVLDIEEVLEEALFILSDPLIN